MTKCETCKYYEPPRQLSPYMSLASVCSKKGITSPQHYNCEDHLRSLFNMKEFITEEEMTL